MMSPPERTLSYGRQHIDDDDVAAVVATLRGDWLTGGPAVEDFERRLGERLRVQHVAACANGTAALHLAVMAAGLEPGGSAIVPSMTFMATANVVRHAGAEVIFADVDAATGLMGPQHLDEALAVAARAGQRPSVVLPVHLNGQCVDLPALAPVARAQGLKIVTDCCHALGTAYRDGAGEALAGDGRYEDLATFSFHPVKAITMGEGGAVTSNDPVMAERVSRLRNHGIVRDPGRFQCREQALDARGRANPWYHEMHAPGWNYRASDIHCALGLSQLAKLDRFIERRRALAALYDRLLEPLAPAVRPVARVPGNRPAWHLYVVQIDFGAAGIARADLMNRLRDRGIGTQVHYLPVHRQPYYRERYGDLALPGADRYYDRALSLPLFVSMADADVERVAGTLAGIIGRG